MVRLGLEGVVSPGARRRGTGAAFLLLAAEGAVLFRAETTAGVTRAVHDLILSMPRAA